MAAEISAIMNRHKALRTAREPWNNQFQLQGEYINLKRTQFYSDTALQTEFLNGQLFDVTAAEVLETAASSILAWLWPNGGRSFAIVPAPAFEQDKEAKDWFAHCTETLAQLMDDDKSGLATSLTEVMEDGLSPGTGFLAVLDDGDTDPNNPLLFEPWGLNECFIWQGKGGKVLGMHRERLLTVTEYVDEYGIDRVPKYIADWYNANQFTESARVLTAIYPRAEKQKRGGSAGMKYASVHIDQKTSKVLYEKGFNEFPVMCLRMHKKSNEAYGRGFGFKALPLAMELNAIWEALTLALEKKLDPALVVLDNGTMGGATVDTSPGAINTVRVNGRAGQMQSPIQPLYDVGDVNGALELVKDLREQVYQFGKLDRLLNSLDDKEMTLGESQMRDSRSNMAMMSPITRCVSELFTPMVDRAFAIALRRGKFGYAKGTVEARVAEARGEEVRYIPDSIVTASEKGIQAYTLRYSSPAARLAYAAEGQGIRATLQDIAGLDAAFPGTKQRVDVDFVIDRLAQINGAPSGMFVSATERKKREAQAQANAETAAAAAAAPEAVNMAKTAAETQAIAGQANAA